MKRLSIPTSILLLLMLTINCNTFAQSETITKENPISLNVDLMSRYIWRGQDFGASPSIQPGISYSNWGFTLGAWGAYTINNVNSSVQEVDLFLSYNINDMFSVTVTDYFFPNEAVDYNYFDYKNESTGHIFEGSVTFNGTEKLPLSIMLASNFYGADAREATTDTTSVGAIQYSTYAELGYTFKYFDIFMGLNLTSPDKDKGETGFYGDSFGVVNLGISATKEIKITEKFGLPLYIALITNPQKEKIYFVAGFKF